MSNIAQFYTKGIPVGGAIQSMPFAGDLWQPGDGTEWYCDSPSAPFAYTSAYANAPDFMLSPHALVNGPESGGTFRPSITTACVAYDKTNDVYVVGPYSGQYYPTSSIVYGINYYYSGDGGTTWTRYTLPNSTTNYSMCQFINGYFYFLASSVSSFQILRSSDGINWTTISVGVGATITCQDIISNGANNVIVVPTATTGAYSTDGGNTFSNSVWSSAPDTTNIRPGSGSAAWCPGANGWIAGTTTAGTYQLSTDSGLTWSQYGTLTSGTANIYSGYFATTTKFASNSTTTVAMGPGGFFATTTDGITWSNHGFINNDVGPTALNQFYFDGTRFVVRSGARVWYASDVSSWTQGKPIGGFATPASQSSGILFPITSTAQAGIPTRIVKVANVASTTPQTIISSTSGSSQSTTQTYYRIK